LLLNEQKHLPAIFGDLGLMSAHPHVNVLQPLV
jgi:hypothetical protein